MEVFFIGESGITEMYVGVDQARGNGKPGCIQDFFLIRGHKSADFGDDAVCYANISLLFGFCCRIHKITVFNNHNLSHVRQNALRHAVRLLPDGLKSV